MPGTKRTHSIAFPEAKSKLAKRKSSIKNHVSSSGDDGPVTLRRSSTMTLEQPEDTPPSLKTLKSKTSVTKATSLTKKASSFVEKGVLVSRLSVLRSGSMVGETSASSSKTSSASLKNSKTNLSLSKSESIRVTAVDEVELSSAVSDLKTHLSKEGSKLSKKSSSVVSVSSLSALKKLSSVKSTSGNDSTADDSADVTASRDRVDPVLPPGGLLELAISFDTTGSMYGCLEEVRAKIQDLVQRLQADIPGIRIAVFAHGDYYDEEDRYVIKWIDFGATVTELCEFVREVSPTSGGDSAECYELVLRRARQVLSWTTGSQRALVLIGDETPHPVGYRYDGKTYNICWKEECRALKDMNVKIYSVQAKNRPNADTFYKEIARITGGCRLSLQKFSSLFDFLMMICYKEGNPDMMAIYQQEILDRGRLADDVSAMTKTFGGEAPASVKLPTKTKDRAKARKPVVPTKVPTAKKTIKGNKTSIVKKGLAAKKSPTPKTMDIAQASKKATRAKKDVKTLTKTSKAAKDTAKRKAAKDKTKRDVARDKAKKKAEKKKANEEKRKTKLRINRVQKRELTDDSCLTKGKLDILIWTDWECAVVPTKPRYKQKSKYTKLRANNGYGPDKLFDNTFEQRAIYEIAVQLPGAHSSKKYTMYMLSKFGFRKVMHWATHILRHKKIRVEVNNVLAQGCSIYIRRGVMSNPPDRYYDRARIKPIENYLNQHFDYAWNKYIWRRTVTKPKSFTLTHRAVTVKRGGTSFILSNPDL